ncbi:MAG: phosphopentomutase [Gemmatimonadaceae bacterium]|nr:phosphopentomutase [Gemmatimonadaceae bacterium]
MTRRAAIVVLDGVGIGEAADAATYGDVGSDTLGNVARAVGGLDLPNLAACGLGNIKPLPGVTPATNPAASYGIMQPASGGKDSTAGHWEIAGVHLAKAFPTFPRGFPSEVIERFETNTGRKVIGNVVGSGTDVMAKFGAEHVRSGSWIVYTSADSVFQVAAHEGVIPIEELYSACEKARVMLKPPFDVSRVIARPFVGEEGNFKRTANRRDFSIEPPEETLLDALAKAGIPRDGVGKTDDLFAGRALKARHTSSNAEGILEIRRWLEGEGGGFLFANLVDFDQLYGHRNDVAGFYNALREFDSELPSLVSDMREDDLLFLTADHGNDPTTASSDHARENVPILVIGQRVKAVDLGVRKTFSDLGATVAEWLGVEFRGKGTSFLPSMMSK